MLKSSDPNHHTVPLSFRTSLYLVPHTNNYSPNRAGFLPLASRAGSCGEYLYSDNSTNQQAEYEGDLTLSVDGAGDADLTQLLRSGIFCRINVLV